MPFCSDVVQTFPLFLGFIEAAEELMNGVVEAPRTKPSAFKGLREEQWGESF